MLKIGDLFLEQAAFIGLQLQAMGRQVFKDLFQVLNAGVEMGE